MNKIHFIEQNLYWNVAKILNNYDLFISCTWFNAETFYIFQMNYSF